MIKFSTIRSYCKFLFNNLNEKKKQETLKFEQRSNNTNLIWTADFFYRLKIFRKI